VGHSFAGQTIRAAISISRRLVQFQHYGIQGKLIGPHLSADDGGRAVIVNVSALKFVTYCNVLARMAFGSVAATAA